MQNVFNPHRAIVIALGILACVLAFFVALYFFIMPSSIYTDMPDISGKILMTGKTTGGIASLTSSIYELDLASHTMNTLRSGGDYYAPATTQNDKVAVVTTDETGEFGLFVADDAQGTNARRINVPAPALYPGVSSWSPDGRYLAYAARATTSKADMYAFADSYIVVLDTTNDIQVILDEGVSPFATSEGVFYVKSDGIYLSRPNSEGEFGLEERMIGLANDRASLYTMVSVSYNGRYIAVTQPHVGMVFVYEQTAEGTYAQKSGLFAIASWPLFSKDGSLLAYLSLNEVDGRRSLEAFHLLRGDRAIIADLSDYQTEFLSLTRWR